MENYNNKPATSSINVNKNIVSHSKKNTNKTISSSDAEWKTQQKPKRILSGSSVSNNPTSPKVQQIRKKLFSTTNRYEVLSQNVNTDENLDNLIVLEPPIIPDTIKPPPNSNNNNSVTNNSLLILQFNANGLKNHALELETVLNKKCIDIALIRETHFTKYSYIHIHGYTLIKTNHPDNTTHGGVAIFVKSPLAFHSLPNFCQDFLQSYAISLIVNTTSLTVAAIYFPLKHTIHGVL
jgi:hypothetical protein